VLEKPEPGVMGQAPRRRAGRLVNRNVLGLAYGFLGPKESILGSVGGFFFVYYMNGWRPSMRIAARCRRHR
jgi:hypothetical protein